MHKGRQVGESGQQLPAQAAYCGPRRGVAGAGEAKRPPARAAQIRRQAAPQGQKTPEAAGLLRVPAQKHPVLKSPALPAPCGLMALLRGIPGVQAVAARQILGQVLGCCGHAQGFGRQQGTARHGRHPAAAALAQAQHGQACCVRAKGQLHFVAKACCGGRGRHRSQQGFKLRAGQAAHALQGVQNQGTLPGQLTRLRQRLQGAAAAGISVRAKGRNRVRGLPQHFRRGGLPEAGLAAQHPGAHLLSRQAAHNKNHGSVQARHAPAVVAQPVDFQNRVCAHALPFCPDLRGAWR